jgi:hypothetical protein
MPIVPLRALAFTRSGDKGDTSNIGVVPYDERHYELLLEAVTVDRVRALFGPLVQGNIVRYELPGIKALNFVLERALSGGVAKSLNLDAHGKSWGNLMLRLPVEVPETVLDELHPAYRAAEASSPRA